ncbi:MAG: serine hydrolase [Elainellaceae cyanobacterium]
MVESSDQLKMARRRRLMRRRSGESPSQPSSSSQRRPLKRDLYSSRSPDRSPDNVIEARQWKRNRSGLAKSDRAGAASQARFLRSASLSERDRPPNQHLLPGSASSEASLPTSRRLRSRAHESARSSNPRMRMGADLRRGPQIPSRVPASRAKSPQEGHVRHSRGGALSRVPPREQLLPVLPYRRSAPLSANAERPVKRLNPRPIPSSQRLRKARKPRQPSRPTSPLVYAIRLLILGVGVGAIAGTLISVLNPAARYQGETAQTLTNSVLSPAESGEGTTSAQDRRLMKNESGRSLPITLQLRKEMRPLMDGIRELTLDTPDLTPGIFLVDFDSGAYLDLNGTRQFSAASMVKVPILVAFFQEVDAGKIRLDKMLTIEEDDIATGSGDLQFQAIGTQYSAIEVATMMITISDNTATNMLIREMGGMEILNRRFQSWGFSTTQLNNLLPDLDGTNMTTPRELVELMIMVSQGDLISMRSRDRLLDIMQSTVTNTLLPAGLAPDAAIAHKTGDIGSMVGDVGVVDMPSGKRYAIATMIQRPHNDERAQDLIRQVSGMVYDYLENPADFQGTEADSDLRDLDDAAESFDESVELVDPYVDPYSGDENW